MAGTIDEVIAQLSAIINQSLAESNRLGFFAALYRNVTVRVKDGIAQGRFQNAERMEELDVIFANRYLEAYEQYCAGLPTSASWAAAFDAGKTWKPLIMQHLLLGINAHINLDLGIAAQQTSPGEKLFSLHQDFEMINTILAELVQPMEDDLVIVSPWFGLIEKINPKIDDAIINFSMSIARTSAWQFALRLNSLNESEQVGTIRDHDQEIAQLAIKIAQPKGLLINIGLLAIRLRESSNVSQVINVIAE